MSDQDLFGNPVTPPPPRAGQYAVIYADPPWNERGGGRIKRGADRHYALMKTSAICALPVWEWAAANAHLYLWVTNNFLEDGLEVMRAWGFRYVTKIDWFKGELDGLDAAGITREVEFILGKQVGCHMTSDLALSTAAHIGDHLVRFTTCDADDADLKAGLGQYFRGVTESCLFGVRGKLPYRTLDNGRRAQGRSGFHAPLGEHSAKPDKMRRMIERVSNGPYLEMFARQPAEGWDVWGNESSGERLKSA